ncbi:hypothetical protein HYPSUDRAFT_764394 [Hypholoma sublateritium FD-334 SS-4]|uniref:MYND-type domain-containing protein n=1 Tax=Hypholoma sublateritium (strain FD-334 SS-4) TaxID=945553 RepID=A0A0D2NQE0_HYPSF|nr:hypothetical protein HYPSUDRAFT_764394 [Hypholoma sublateritium FD-334 SS-4]
MVFPETCHCGNFSHHDYDTMTKYQADRLMSLLMYLHHNNAPPKWVRATYVTPRNNYGLDPAFLSSTTAPPPAEMRDRLAQGRAPLFHVAAEDFIPSLLSSDVEKIDNLRATKGGAHPVPEVVRAKVIGSKTTRPQVASKVFKEKNVRECAFCREAKEKDLMVCSRCKLVYYCGRECQRLAWPAHKLFCKG